MNRRTKTMLIAMIALCISALLVVGGSYALFTGNVSVNNHLEAGSLKIGLNRISYKEHVIDENTGLMTDKPVDTTVVDLTANANPIFTADNSAPTSSYEAVIEIKNKGTVAFNYGMRILWNGDNTASNAQMAFAEQLQITVSGAGLAAPVVFRLSDCLNVGDIALGAMNKGADAQTFTVTALFLDHADNNDAMEAELNFDVQVYATQKLA